MTTAQKFSLTRMGLAITLFVGVLVCILLAPSQIASDSLIEDKTVSIQYITTKPVQYQDSYSPQRDHIGQLEAKQTSNLGFEIGGMLNHFPYDEGQEVKAGTMLASLDTARLEAQKKQAEANLAAVKANAALAETTYKRFFTAQKANAVTIQAKDEAREARDVSKAAVILAKAQLESILVDISKTRLLAPYDGMIVKRMVDLGEVVTTGQPILTIQQSGNFDIRLGVTDEIANQFQLGDKQSVLINGVEYQGRVKAILPARNAARAIDVIVALEEQSAKLRAGDMARIAVKQAVNKRGFWVPLTALKEGQRGLWSLYVLSENNTSQRKTVDVYYANELEAYVFGAIKPSESIIVEGASKLVPGQKVKLANIANDEK